MISTKVSSFFFAPKKQRNQLYKYRKSFYKNKQNTEENNKENYLANL